MSNWREVLGDLAYMFHFSATELLNMTTEELELWAAQAERIGKRLNGAR